MVSYNELLKAVREFKRDCPQAKRMRTQYGALGECYEISTKFYDYAVGKNLISPHDIKLYVLYHPKQFVLEHAHSRYKEWMKDDKYSWRDFDHCVALVKGEDRNYVIDFSVRQFIPTAKVPTICRSFDELGWEKAVPE